MHKIIDRDHRVQNQVCTHGRAASVNNISYVFDDNSNISVVTQGTQSISRLYDAENRVYEKEQTGYGTISYQYDITSSLASGEVAELATHPDGRTVKKVYDKVDRLKAVYQNAILEAAYTYFDTGRLETVTYQNGIEISYEYYPDGQLESMVTKDGTGTELYNFGYQYDPNNNLIYKDEASGEKNYTYDQANRLKTETAADSSLINMYEYDKAHNRVKDYTTDLSLFEAQTNAAYSYDEQNRLTSLTSGNATHTYSYNPENYRTRKNTTHYAYEYDKPIAEYTLSGTTATVTAFNLFGTSLICRTMGAQKYYYLYNAHGDVIALTDASGDIVAEYEYDSWGAITAKTGNISNPFRYSGYVYDEETGLYYLNARYYDPVIGRFLTEDTYLGERTDPLSLNLYAYVLGNPHKYFDPSGRNNTAVADGYFAGSGIELGTIGTFLGKAAPIIWGYQIGDWLTRKFTGVGFFNTAGGDLDGSVSIPHLAEIMNMQPTYLIRKFKKIFKQSPMRYYNSLRADEAATLLLTTNKSIKETGICIGLHDQSYFIQFFEKFKNVTPVEYKKLFYFYLKQKSR